MNRDKMIDWLVANGWDDDADRDILEGLDDTKLKLLASNAMVANAATTGFRDGGSAFWLDPADGEWKKQVVNADGDDEEEEAEAAPPEDDDDDEGEEDTTVQNRRQLTANQWLASAPAEIRSAVENAMEIETHAKAEICKQLVANLNPTEQRAEFNELMGAPLVDLRKQLRRMGAPVNNTPDNRNRTDYAALFLGAGGGVATTNEDMPVLDLATERQKYDPMILNKKAAGA